LQNASDFERNRANLVVENTWVRLRGYASQDIVQAPRDRELRRRELHVPRRARVVLCL